MNNTKVAQILSHLVIGDGVGKVAVDIAEGLKTKGVTTDFIILTGKHDALKSVLENKGYRVYLYSAHSSFKIKHFLPNVKTIFSLARQLKTNDYQIVQCHEYFAGTLGRLAALLACNNIKILQSYHNPDHWKSLPHILVDKLLSLFTIAFTANSEAVKRFYIKTQKIDPPKINVIYNGIDTRELVNIKPSNKGRKVVVGSIGRLAKQKGYAVLVSAAAIALKQYPNLEFVIYGPDGHSTETEKPEIERLIKDYGLNGSFILKGPTSNIAAALSQFDIFVAPSRWEGFGLANVEAMAAGLPVVSTTVDAIPEVVENGVTGFLVPPDDPPALARAILTLVHNQELREQMGQKGRKRAMEHFERSIMAGNYGKLYLSILK